MRSSRCSCAVCGYPYGSSFPCRPIPGAARAAADRPAIIRRHRHHRGPTPISLHFPARFVPSGSALNASMQAKGEPARNAARACSFQNDFRGSSRSQLARRKRNAAQITPKAKCPFTPQREMVMNLWGRLVVKTALSWPSLDCVRSVGVRRFS